MVFFNKITSTTVLSVLGLATTLTGAMPMTDNPTSASCTNRGVDYSHGERVTGSTLTCTCDNGQWINCERNAEEPDPTDEDNILPGAQVGFNTFINNFENEDFVIDFSDVDAVPVVSKGLGGTVQPASLNDFPVMQVGGMAQTRFHIGPCGINMPHVHPRGTESIYVVNGELTVGFVTEGGRLIINDISADQSTFFPLGLLHYQQNLGCEPASFISILNNADPGLLVISAALMTLPDIALSVTFDEDEAFVTQLRLGLPAGPARGRAECLARCNLPLDTPLES
eukprot:CFRG4996T1